MAKQSVQELLDDIRLVDNKQYALVQSVRSLVNRTFPDVSEEVKYGGILFSAGILIGGVFAYKQHVSVEFSHGADIRDEFGHLEGGGRFRRHIKLYAMQDIEEKELVQYLLLALEAAESAS